MKIFLNFVCWFVPVFVFVGPAIGAAKTNPQQKIESQEPAYFKALDAMSALPKGYLPVLPCAKNEVENLIKRLNKTEYFMNDNHLRITENQVVTDSFDTYYEFYKGDFSNEGLVEYAVVSRAGSAHVNTVDIYKLEGEQLIDKNFEQVFSKLNPDKIGYDGIYLHVAEPFAMSKNGKTYLRFMDYRFENKWDYDQSKVILCTYLWEKDQITLTGPNGSYKNKKSALSKIADCRNHSVSRAQASGVRH